MTPAIKISVVALAGVLGGCATTSVDRNFNQAQSVVQQRFGVDAKWLRPPTKRGAKRRAKSIDFAAAAGPTTPCASRSPTARRCRRCYSKRAASASATQSARLPNPVFTFERLVRNEGGKRELEISRMLRFSVLDLLLLPARLRAADYQQQQSGWTLATNVVQAATDAAPGVGARRGRAAVAAVRRAGQGAAEASAELARRMQPVGNFSKLQRAREQAFYADAARNWHARSSRASPTRAKLVRALGLNEAAAQRLTLPERLPDLPARRRDSADAAQRRWTSASTCRWRALDSSIVARDAGPDARRRASSTCSSSACANESARPASAARTGYELEIAAADLRLGRRARASAAGAYMAGAEPRRADRGRRQLAGARELRRLPHRLRPRPPLPRRDRAAAQDASPTKTCFATTAC